MEINIKEKDELIEQAIKQVEKEFGKGAIMLLSDSSIGDIEVISSGSILLDDILGVKGFPKGRIVEIYGSESAGKTTLALMALAQTQKQNGKIAFIDAEHALDRQYSQKLGVDINGLLITQPDSGEQALEILDILVKSQALDMIVIDSVAALVPQVELDGDMNEQTIGVQARLMSKALRKLSGSIAKTNCIVLFINQIREKVGIIYGNSEITPGGKALRFYSTIRLEVRKGEQLIRNNQIVGHKIKIKVVKNKVAPPFKTVSLDFYFEEGFSKIGEIISIAVEQKIINKSGGWYSYEDVKLGQGKIKIKESLEANTFLLEQIKEQIKF
ncbi:recombinase RecA [Spiroplasma endosymbiont of Polydrusus pterygomalis]|uniref:recombinase RecA n=1 Tax=Spiroplasma endosymbiont of Polydrusus pterygomalis TaxID=3139327 RepID=UPI003CCB288D